MNFVIDHSYLIPLLPLLAAVVAGFFGSQYLKDRSHWPVWIAVGIGAVLSLVLLLGMLGTTGHEEGHWFRHANWFTWMDTGHGPVPQYDPSSASMPQRFVATAGALIDPLSAVMLCVVCGIGFLITVFAAGYMHGEEGYFRFFAYLGLFIFAMTCLVMGENLVMLYLGWEGVGLCSYLLIGYYYEKPSAREAARKAFLVNRVGDFGFGVGIMLTFLVFGTVSYFGQEGGPQGFLELAAIYTTDAEKFASLPEWKQSALYAIPFCLMIGAFGKSAQFPLHVWLPDAMEGPTPVSALIHAATMVTAGVYMIARCSTVFVWNQTAMLTVAAIGLFTAIFAATIALRQFDLKKVFAYSTVSQLGFMFVAVGLLAPVAGVFHLVTHAFFKALLFLSSGVVMHAMAGELDMRKMSGLKRVLPKTRWLMLIGCLALAGMIPFSGFWSKDEIVVAAYLRMRHDTFGAIAFMVLLATAFMTAYYTFRLYFRVFEGPEVLPPEAAEALAHRGGDATATATTGHGLIAEAEQAHAHDDAHHGHHDPEPPVMIYPLYVLAAGAALVGFLNTPVAHFLGEFLGKSPSFFYGYNVAVLSHGAGSIEPLAFGQHDDAHHGVEWVPMLLSIVVSAAGIGLAYLLHLADRPRGEEIAGKLRPVTLVLEAKYWVDEIYQGLIVAPLRAVGRAFYAFDRWVIDGLVLIVSLIPQAGGWVLKLGIQRGYMQGYAAVMLFGLAIILLIIFL